MKTITKLAALGVVALGLAGCAEDNEKKAMATDPNTGKGATVGTTPANAPKSSDAFRKGAVNPMTNNAAYKDAGK